MVMTNNETTVTENKCDNCAHICPHCGVCDVWYMMVAPDECCKYYERREDTDA